MDVFEQEVRIEIREATLMEKLDLWTAVPIPGPMSRLLFDPSPCECGDDWQRPTHLGLLSGALYFPEHEGCEGMDGRL